MNSTPKWLGPISGLLAVVAVVVGAGISGGIESEPSDQASDMLAELRESADDTRLGAVVGVLAAGLLLIYIGHLRTRLQDDGAGWAGSVFAAGGVALVAAVLVLVGVALTGAEAGDQSQTEVAQFVVDFAWNGAWLFSPGLLAIGVGVAVASFSSGSLPKWLGALGVVIALSAIAPWIGVPIFGLWVLAASVDELISTRRAPPTP